PRPTLVPYTTLFRSNVTGTHRVGGITGSGNSYNADNTMIIENCYNTGSLSVTSSTSTSSIGIGGIIGYFALNDPIYNPKGTIKHCYNTGSISRSNSSNYAVGIIGGAFYYANNVDIIINYCIALKGDH